MIKDVDITEQWSRDGRCNECRRSKYCNKACKANKDRFNNDVGAVINKKLGGLLSGRFVGSEPVDDEEDDLK